VRLTVHSDFRVANGTHFVGTVQATYRELVHAFGEPMPGDGDKVQADWVLEFETDGERVIATVYDWKQYNTNLDNILVWHVGGFDFVAQLLVDDYLNYMRDIEANRAY
jgi:hypothetical protein